MEKEEDEKEDKGKRNTREGGPLNEKEGKRKKK